MKNLIIGCLAALAVASFGLPARGEFTIGSNDRVILFGDEAFAAPFFDEWIDQLVRVRYPESKAEFICFAHGKMGSTIEEAANRLKKEVLPLKPTQVVMCFGLDHAGRKPFDQKRLDTFNEHMTAMIEQLKGSGAKVLLVTPPPPEESRNRGLEHAKYAEVIDKYAEAVRKLAEEKDAVLIDWHKAVGEYKKEHPKTADYPLTRHGLMPTGLSIAIVTDLLLTHWKAEPIEYVVQADWNSDAASASRGSATVSRSEGRMVLALSEVPIPLAGTDQKDISPDDWPVAKWSQYRLKIANMPEGGALISSHGKGAKPYLSQQLEEGANLTIVQSLFQNPVVTNFYNAIRTKINQFGKYRASCLREAPEPELVEGYRLYLEAEKSLAFGAYKIAMRMPVTYAATLDVELVSHAMKARKPEPAPKAPVTSRPARGRRP